MKMAAATQRTIAAPPPLSNSYWVVPGQVLAGEYPAGPDPEKTRERLQRLLDAGIECFIDLTEPEEMPPYDSGLPEGIDYLRRPIQDHALPQSTTQMIRVLESITEALRAGRPVYVHCRAGIGRTGTAMGCLLVERGFTGEQALEELNHLWQKCKRSLSWPFIPETDEQASYVRTWNASLAAAGSNVIVPDPRPLAPAAAQLGALAMTPGAAPAVAKSGSPTRRGRSPKLPRGTSGRSPSAASPSGAPAKSSAGVAVAALPAADAAEDAADGAFVARAPSRKSPGARAAARAGPDPLFEPATLAAARGLRGRFLGALVGLAVGDAVAAATQYKRRNSFAAVGDMLGGGPFDLPRGGWSDDTAMALCLAESLLACSGFDARDQVQRYVRWQQDGHLSATGQCLGITANTARALAMAHWRRQVFPGSHDPDQLDVEPLSRVAPAVMFAFAAPDNALLYAADAARITCQAPIVLEACRTLARVLHAALAGQSRKAVVELAPPVTEAAARSNGTAPAALSAALWAFASTDNFRDAVLRAANLGGNSDVVAAVCGQLAGACYGVGSIPGPWRNALLRKDLIENFADRLLQVALVSLSG